MSTSDLHITTDDILTKISAHKPADLETWFRLLEYHEKRMEVRRAIGLRMFTGLVAMNLLILNGVVSHKELANKLFWPLAIFLVAMAILLLAALFCIEAMNWRDRQMYHPLLGALDVYLAGATHQETTREPLWKSVLGSWAGTWPAFASIAITAASLVALKQLP